MRKKKVLITRAAEQAAEFAAILEEKGLEPVIFPVITFVPPEDRKPIKSALKNLHSFDWLILTSTNGIKFFLKYLEESGRKRADLEGMKVCAVGPKTAEYAKEAGINIDLLPEEFQAEGVLEAFADIDLRGKRILFPRAEEGRGLLPEGLVSMGAEVGLVTVYRTVKPGGKKDELKTLLKKGIDVVTFTSGSTVRNFIDILGDNIPGILKDIKVACISGVTADIAEDNGLCVDIIAKENTTESLAEAIALYFN